jgi:uncharacterized protein YlbG (UPF0298 family)
MKSVIKIEILNISNKIIINNCNLRKIRVTIIKDKMLNYNNLNSKKNNLCKIMDKINRFKIIKIINRSKVARTIIQKNNFKTTNK